MKTLIEYIQEADKGGWALGHFNISNIEGLWGVFRAAEAEKLPVIIGVSEGERNFIGIKQVKALVDSLKAEYNYPIFLNADHTYSLEEIKKVVDAGYDSVVVDGSKLSLEDNITLTKTAVAYAKSVNPNILVEGEIGYIGTSSKLLDEIPEEAAISGEALPSPEIAAQFVQATGVDLLAPAVGNLHGMLKSGTDPRLDIELIKNMRTKCGVPLVLHGGSGITDEDFRSAIKAGVSMIHINTEIRIVFRDALKIYLQNNPDEIAPYKIMAPSMHAIEQKTTERLRLFAGR
ncbi:MAG: hypothetical protein A2571_03240 [Candidatus Vogelbacteria bacterium RIFOXYD1_FULL_44_32]|uniref:Tagatose-bisphosphate aldolase n=1 Tax=Candidatus Vogelbacteria bacterium RIFOXYD1_FULL_44_32 TaxID=1802438 RepID=A0A1G2QCE3_9BACT|nr:MAG: hypothetical protein A2571_03240 [Candidatus Vogelbacteria bacterium RIFOXYD1_FULL_44_32]